MSEETEMSMIVLNAAASHLRPELLKFLEWLERHHPARIEAKNHSKILDEYFGIDRTKLESERRLLMEGMRAEDNGADGAIHEHKWQHMESGSRRYDYCVICGREKPR